MKYDFTVIGAGIVGLSTAYKLSLAFPDAKVLVLEKESGVARHQTGKNSGVIHSGIYYKPGSYKARNCVDGRHQMVDFCQKHDIQHDVCGKIIVAQNEAEIPTLERIYERGLQNKIEGIELISRERMLEIEPHVAGVKAINVPCTGIVDFSGMCEKLAELIRANGGETLFNQKVIGFEEFPDLMELKTESDAFQTNYVINCAGLQCDLVAKAAGIEPPLQIVPFKGEYYELKKESEYKVNHLIYPLPHKDFPFLGVHFTRMAVGGIECGPNAVFAFKREGYEKVSFDLKDTLETLGYSGFWKLAMKHWRMGVDEYKRSFSKAAFVRGLQQLIPSIQEEDLEEAPAGVRAMALKPNGEILDDFFFMKQKRAIHVLNAPSPAATAGLSIADEIVKQCKEHFEIKALA